MAQANAEGEQQKWLTLSHLYGSKVAIPGELDWAVDLGVDDDKRYESWRFLNLCKNKFGKKSRAYTEFNESTCEFKEVKSHGVVNQP